MKLSAMTEAEIRRADRTLSAGTWTITFGAVLYSVLTVTPLVERVTPDGWGWTAPILPIVVDAAVVIVVRLDAVVSRLDGRAGGWPVLLRWLTGLMTLLLNVGDSALKGDAVGVAVHAVAPLLLIVTAEAALSYRRAITQALARIDREREERAARERAERERREREQRAEREERERRERAERERREREQRAEREERERREREERERERTAREQSEREAREHAERLERERLEREAEERRAEREHAAQLQREQWEREERRVREQREAEERARREERERLERERREREERERLERERLERERAARERAARERAERERAERERAEREQRAPRERTAAAAVSTPRPAVSAPVSAPVSTDRKPVSTPAKTTAHAPRERSKMSETEARATVAQAVRDGRSQREIAALTGWSAGWVAARCKELAEVAA